jgi:hypothetical protein
MYSFACRFCIWVAQAAFGASFSVELFSPIRTSLALVDGCYSAVLHFTIAIFGEMKIANAEEYDIGSNGFSAADRMHASALGGTAHDASDMHRMGKKQELRVLSPTEPYTQELG